MKFLIVFATIILAINAATDQEQWQAFKVKMIINDTKTAN